MPATPKGRLFGVALCVDTLSGGKSVRTKRHPSRTVSPCQRESDRLSPRSLFASSQHDVIACWRCFTVDGPTRKRGGHIRRRPRYVTHAQLEERLERVATNRRLTAELVKIDTRLKKLEQTPAPPGAATHAVLTIGAAMPGQINIDTKNETAKLSFTDDHGNATAAPAGATVAYTSDATTVATVAADAADPYQADVTPVGLGTATISAALSGALEADGVTPIPNPSPVVVTVGPGPASGAAFMLTV